VKSKSSPKERRKHPRLSRAFDGNWRGASGGSTCRISDLSLGGCYVQTKSVPAKGADTTVTIRFGESHVMTFPAKVMSADPGIGFGVEFKPMTRDVAKELQSVIDAMQNQPY
jgi:hypothetical protein